MISDIFPNTVYMATIEVAVTYVTDRRYLSGMLGVYNKSFR